VRMTEWIWKLIPNNNNNNNNNNQYIYKQRQSHAMSQRRWLATAVIFRPSDNPKTRWCIYKWAICDFQGGDGWNVTDGRRGRTDTARRHGIARQKESKYRYYNLRLGLKRVSNSCVKTEVHRVRRLCTALYVLRQCVLLWRTSVWTDQEHACRTRHVKCVYTVVSWWWSTQPFILSGSINEE